VVSFEDFTKKYQSIKQEQLPKKKSMQKTYEGPVPQGHGSRLLQQRDAGRMAKNKA
jgi:hypothetical protein